MHTALIMSITLITGPMFSGKTSEMLAQVRRASYAKQTSLIVKYSGDTRYTSDTTITTHDGLHQACTSGSAYAAPIHIVSASSLADVDVSEFTTIGVDEGQFYPDLAQVCETWAQAGKHVIVSALDGDYKRTAFPQVSLLAPLCELVEKKQGICMKCYQHPSSFTERISGGTDVVQIGANDSYRAVCRSCFTHYISTT